EPARPRRHRAGPGTPALGYRATGRAQGPDRPGAAHSRVRRAGADQPRDRAEDVPGRQDSQELRVEHAGQAGAGAANAGRRAGDEAAGPPAALTRRTDAALRRRVAPDISGYVRGLVRAERSFDA